MPTITLRFEFAPEAAAQVESLRGDIPLDEFLNRCIQVGLLDFAEEAARMHRDFIYQEMINRTDYYRKNRMSRQLTTVAATDVSKIPRSP